MPKPLLRVRNFEPAQKVFWGGTSGYFADPDGHLWEVAHNPFFPLDEEGACNSRFRDVKHDSYPDTYIAGILNDCRVFAFVGASEKNNRPSYFAMKYLLGKGYTVIPVNPMLKGAPVLGQKPVDSIEDLTAPVDVIDIFRHSTVALDITRKAITLKDKLGLKVIWMQLGVRNDEAAASPKRQGFASS